MKNITQKLLLFIALMAVSVLSCKKDSTGKKEKFIVSASKIIAFTGSNWNDTEPQVKDKLGYVYEAALPSVTTQVKGEANFPAIDDSSRIDSGAIYFNVRPDNIIGFAVYDAQPMPKPIAYGMMLNYYHESLRTLTPMGITSTTGSLVDNTNPGSSSVDSLLQRLKTGRDAKQLGISFKISGRAVTYTLVVFQQPDGQYQFSYRGFW